MFRVFFALFLGVSFIQILNYLFVKIQMPDQGVLLSNFKLVMYTLPLQIIASMSYVYFYNKGYTGGFSYLSLSLMSFACSLMASCIVSILFLNMRMPTLIEFAAYASTLLGIGLFIYAKNT